MTSRAAGGAGALYITRGELCRRWNVSRATSYRLQAQGYLRPPVKLGPGLARWPIAEIQEIERRAAADRGDA